MILQFARTVLSALLRGLRSPVPEMPHASVAEHGLLPRVLNGLIYVGFSNYFIYLSNLIASVLLARLLAPEVFGTVAMAGSLVVICSLIRQLGFDAALLQRRDINRTIAATHFSLNLTISLALILFGLLVSPLVNHFYGRTVTIVFLSIVTISLADAFAGHANILLQKQLSYHTTSLISAAGAFLGCWVALALAWAGAGVWALVAGDATNRFLSAFLLWRACPERPRLQELRWNVEEVGWYLRFGPWWASLLSGISLFAILHFDNFLVGTLAGSAALGLYSRAYNWATLPTARITWMISSVAQPVYARLQGDRIRLSQAFNASLSAITRLSFLFASLMLVVAEDAVRLVLGEQWLPTVPILRWFALYAVLRPLSDDLGAVFAMSGRMRIANLAGTGQAIGLAITLPPAIVLFGAPGAAGVVGLSYACMLAYLYSRRLPEFIDLQHRAVFLPPLAGGLLATAAGFTAGLWLPGGALVPAVAKAVITLAVYAGTLLVLEGRLLRQQLQLVVRSLGGSLSKQPVSAVSPEHASVTVSSGW